MNTVLTLIHQPCGGPPGPDRTRDRGLDTTRETARETAAAAQTRDRTRPQSPDGSADACPDVRRLLLSRRLSPRVDSFLLNTLWLSLSRRSVEAVDSLHDSRPPVLRQELLPPTSGARSHNALEIVPRHVPPHPGLSPSRASHGRGRQKPSSVRAQAPPVPPLHCLGLIDAPAGGGCPRGFGNRPSAPGIAQRPHEPDLAVGS